MTKEFEEAERVLRQVIEKISPAVLEIAVRRDNGKIEIHFGHGEYKMAIKQASL